MMSYFKLLAKIVLVVLVSSILFVSTYYFVTKFSSSAPKTKEAKNSDDRVAEENTKPRPKPRIVLKAEVIKNTDYLYIYEIDGVEYIINGNGGIYPLIKK